MRAPRIVPFLTRWTLQLDGAIVARVDTDGEVSEIDLTAATDDGRSFSPW